MAATVVALKRHHAFCSDIDLIDTYAPQIGPHAVAIYYVLRRHANRETGQCWPSISTIAQKLKINNSTVKRHIQKLVDIGLAIIEPRWSEKGDRTSNLYTLRDPASKPETKTAPPPGEPL
jgi:replication initiation and membrane attachment protein DnaB